MKIAIIGAGNVGTALGEGFSRAGHEVIYGVRDPKGEAAAELRGAGAAVAEMAAAASSAEVVVLTTPWGAVESVLLSLGDLGGKVLIDVTNPIGPGFSLTHGLSDSGAEQVQRWAASARVVKAFNTNGVEVMRSPKRKEGASFMPVCADDAGALEVGRKLAEDLGYDVVTYPKLADARLLEPLTLLWIKTAGRLGSREIAFRLVRS